MTNEPKSLRDLLATPPPPERDRPRLVHPKGWEPGVEYDPTSGRGHLIVQADEEPDPAIWEHLIADWGLDPSRTAVVPGSVQVRAWDAAVGNGEVRRFRYYRASIVSRRKTEDRVDVEALCKRIEKLRPVKAVVLDTATDRALVVCLSDFQMGKGEGDGSEGTVIRLLDYLPHLLARLDELRRAGRPVSVVYLVGMGDLVEGCVGHYAMQSFSVDLDRREQKRVVRRLILKYVDALVGKVPRIVLTGVPGNHGENRNGDGKAFTSFSDNDDLAVIEEVAEILAANTERYGSVSTFLPSSLSMTVDVAGVPCGFAHMHQAKTSGTPQQKVERWWAGHAMGRGDIGDAQLLFTAHYHHFVMNESTGRTWFQCPASDPGSAWWTEQTGNRSPHGLLTVGVGECYGPRGWGDLQVIA